jgi:aspartate carbamoyltransferase catalytic subunit
MAWNRKHLLDIESLSADEINTVLDTSKAFKAVGERAIKKVPALRGKTVVNLFVEPSTRTRRTWLILPPKHLPSKKAKPSKTPREISKR